jgi:hypothetical protein
MDRNYRKYVAHQWKQYFKDAALPLAYFYSNEVSREDAKDSRETDRCLICNLSCGIPGKVEGERYKKSSNKVIIS